MPKKPIAYRGSEPFVFVSYAHADAELAYPLISGLQERGFRVWFDDGLDVGDIWEEVLADHVEQCAAMLCLVSTRFTDSNNCLDEIYYAKEKKRELLILHLEDEALPRNFQFRYGRFHALRLSEYPEQGTLLEKLAATEKLRCCIGQMQEEHQEPEESPEDIFQRGRTCYNEEESFEEAVEWYRKAAALGHPRAMCCLGNCYRQGRGVLRSDEEAVAWFHRSANLGYAKAMHNLSLCYTRGKGVTKDEKQAEYWRNRAKQANA